MEKRSGSEQMKSDSSLNCREHNSKEIIVIVGVKENYSRRIMMVIMKKARNVELDKIYCVNFEDSKLPEKTDRC
jgi:hypothetical protein